MGVRVNSERVLQVTNRKRKLMESCIVAEVGTSVIAEGSCLQLSGGHYNVTVLESQADKKNEICFHQNRNTNTMA